MAETYEHIAYEVEDGILTLTLDRPDKLNAFTPRMQQELVDAFDRVDADDEVRAVVVTGRGRGFCAGADLSAGGSTFDYEAQGAAATDDRGLPPRDGGGQVTLRIFQSTKPVIAAVNGPAVGVGATMTLPMDVRLASDSARFGFVFTRRGLVPEAASSWFLPRVVGISRAMEWVCTGRAARALAREMAEGTSPVSVALSRQMLWRMLGAPHPMDAHRIDSRGIAARGASADAREGVESFLEKRPASFPLRVSDGMPDFYPWWDEPGFS